MMSIKARDAQSAVSYYTHMSQDEAREVDDYYAKEGAGWWYGAGADAIGLSGPVDAQDFRDVAEGFGPDGLALTQNSGKPDRRAGYDATLSAPKSVSVVWGLGDESTRAAIEEAHQNAVRAALDQMQEHALTTRRGSGSWKHERGALVASVFDHGTSREQDMQLHSHCFIHNVAQREDGTWGTIESKYLYQYTKGLGAAYRAELARELQRAGYEVERDRDSFRIASISKDVEREFSKRRQQIEAEMAERGVSGARAAEAATLSTRSRKEERDQDELRQEWRDRAAEFGLTQEHVTADLEHPVDPLDDGLSAEELIEVATANDAVVREQDLFRVAAVEAQTLGLGASDISGMVGEMKQHAVALVDDHGHTIYTSRQLLDAEHEVMAIAQAGRESTAHHVDQANIDAAKARVKEVEGFALADDQAAAVDYLLTESGSVSVIIGDAGTGKSTSMKVFKEAQEMAGRRVLGAAPSGKAASGLEESTSVESQELQKATGIESYTIDALVGRIEKGKIDIDPKTSIVLDEAGMVDSRKLNKLLVLAHERGASVVLAGDHKQLQPVGAGALLRHLSDEERGVGHARIHTIFRQRDEEHKQAVTQMSRGEAAEAMLWYIDQGNVTVAQTYRQATKIIAEKYMRKTDYMSMRDTVILTATNQAARDINQKIRDQLRARGELGESFTVDAFREEGRDLRSGKMITDIEKDVEYSVGDRIVYAHSNDYEHDLKRGDQGEIVGISDDGKLQIKLDRGGDVREVDPHEKDIRHGYAITTHKSQGMSVEDSIDYVDRNMTREMGYVQASRAKNSTEWVITAHSVKQLSQTVEVPEQPAQQMQAIDNPRLAEFRGVVEAMAQSRQADSTLDYQLAPWQNYTPPEITIKPKPEHVHETSRQRGGYAMTFDI